MSKFLDATGVAHLWGAVETKISEKMTEVETNLSHEALSTEEIDEIIANGTTSGGNGDGGDGEFAG